MSRAHPALFRANIVRLDAFDVQIMSAPGVWTYFLEWLQESPPGELDGTVVGELGDKIRVEAVLLRSRIIEGDVLSADLPKVRDDALGNALPSSLGTVSGVSLPCERPRSVLRSQRRPPWA